MDPRSARSRRGCSTQHLAVRWNLRSSAGDHACRQRAGRGHPLHARWQRARSLRSALRTTDQVDSSHSAARTRLQARLYAQHYEPGSFHRGNAVATGTTVMPHGDSPAFTRAISLSVLRSTTEMSFDGPLAE